MSPVFFTCLEMFEGLGLGSRLSQLELPIRHQWLPLASGIFYAFVTPIGLAIGLGVRNTCVNSSHLLKNYHVTQLDDCDTDIGRNLQRLA